jgi:microcystin-dependent protein
MPPTYTTPSTKYGIHRIDGSTNVSDIDAALNQSVDDIDARMAGYAEGTLSARSGVAATAGKLYRTTDTGQVFMGTGSAWIEIGVTPWYVGDLKWSWGTVDHGAWLLCDGRNVSRTTYAALFAWMGVSAGAGDGSTTFGIPDFRGRTLVMPDGTAGRMASGDDRGAARWRGTAHAHARELPAHPYVQRRARWHDRGGRRGRRAVPESAGQPLDERSAAAARITTCRRTRSRAACSSASCRATGRCAVYSHGRGVLDCGQPRPHTCQGRWTRLLPASLQPGVPIASRAVSSDRVSRRVKVGHSTRHLASVRSACDTRRVPDQ